jgi:hypothetical protein
MKKTHILETMEQIDKIQAPLAWLPAKAEVKLQYETQTDAIYIGTDSIMHQEV